MGGLMVKTIGIYLLTLLVSLLVALIIKGIVVLLRWLEHDAKGPEAPRVPMAKVPMSAGAVPADHVAAIGAAVYAMIGDHHIVHIEEPHRGSGWLAEGRQAHHASHAIEHQRRKSGPPQIRGGRG